MEKSTSVAQEAPSQQEATVDPNDKSGDAKTKEQKREAIGSKLKLDVSKETMATSDAKAKGKGKSKEQDEKAPVEDLKSIQAKVSSSRAKGGVSVLTWNVWFGDRHEANEAMAKRCDAILDYLGSIGADIMCLQEVTETLLEKMKKASWVKADYDLSRDTVSGYTSMIVARKELKASFAEVDFPSIMGRQLHIMKTTLSGSGDELVVGCVHLESMNSASTRRKQLRIAYKNLKGPGTRLLCGDFNFCSYRNYNPEIEPQENDVIREELAGCVDIWPALNPNQKGYTFDSERNTNVMKYERMRYDRIVGRSGTLAFRSMTLVGLEKVDLEIEEPKEEVVTVLSKKLRKLSTEYGSNVHMSDHFGLITHLAPMVEGEARMEGMAEDNAKSCIVS